MTRTPTDLSGREVVTALEKLDSFCSVSVAATSFCEGNNPIARVVVPDHKAIRLGTLRSILKQAGITVEELLRLL